MDLLIHLTNPQPNLSPFFSWTLFWNVFLNLVLCSTCPKFHQIVFCAIAIIIYFVYGWKLKPHFTSQKMWKSMLNIFLPMTFIEMINILFRKNWLAIWCDEKFWKIIFCWREWYESVFRANDGRLWNAVLSDVHARPSHKAFYPVAQTQQIGSLRSFLKKPNNYRKVLWI